MLGLALANRLARPGRRVTVIEAAEHLGGLASAWRIGGIVWDRHYHVILQSDTRLRALLDELGLEKEIEWVETRTGCYARGTLYSVSNTIELLRFPVLGLLDKLRLAITLFYGSKIRDGRRLEKILVSSWLRRWSGARVLENFWLPLLRSKLGDNYRVTSAAFIWAVIRRLYAARQKGLKKEMFGYVPGGYARILERFAEHLTERGVEIRIGRRVREIRRDGEFHRVHYSNETSDSFDRVVVTFASPLASRVCPELTPEEHRLLRGIKYQGIICASVLLSRPLGGYYVTSILDDGFPFTGVIEMSSLVDRRQFDGHHLVYLPRYSTEDDPFYSKTDAQVQAEFTAALERMHPGLDQDDVIAFRVSRIRHVLALSTLNYSDALPPIRTSSPGLYLVNSSHIVNGTLNVNETVQLAERALATLQPRDPSPGPPS